MNFCISQRTSKRLFGKKKEIYPFLHKNKWAFFKKWIFILQNLEIVSNATRYMNFGVSHMTNI